MSAFVPLAAVFLFGAAIGSFLNVVALRTLSGESIVYPPSHCPRCSHRLGAKDLLPIISYLLLKGRHCGGRISPQYPLVEVAVGALFGGLFALYGPALKSLWLAAFFAALAVATVTDLKEGVVPYGPLIWSAAAIIGLKLAGSRDGFLSDLLAAAVMFFVLALPAKFNLVGEGDAPVGVLVGFSLGPAAAAAALFWAVVLGGAYGAALLVKNSRNSKKAVPFVPFMAAGCAVAVFLPGATWFLPPYTVV